MSFVTYLLLGRRQGASWDPSQGWKTIDITSTLRQCSVGLDHVLAPDGGKLADAGPETSLSSGDLEQPDDGNADHRGEGDAPTNGVRPAGIVVRVVLVPRVVLDREVQDQLGRRFVSFMLKNISFQSLKESKRLTMTMTGEEIFQDHFQKSLG